MRSRLAAWAGVLALIATGAACTSSNGGTAAGAGPAARYRVASATSGVYQSAGSDASVSAFASWRGRRVALLHVFSAATWWRIEHPLGLANRTRLFLSLGLLPVSDPGPTLAECAAGDYDTHFATAARSIIAAGHGDSYIRLGWEFNNPSSRWTIDPTSANGHMDGTDNYVLCYRRAVSAMRAVPRATGLRFVWSPRSGTSANLPDPAAAYPGDGYVDVIAPDQYDKWYNHPGAPFLDRWSYLLHAGGRGLKYYVQLAESHHKMYGYSEWGLWDPTSTSDGVSQGGGGDDPAYILAVARQLATVRAAGTPTLENYFDASAGDGDHYIGPGPSDFPNAAAVYMARF